MSIMQRSYDPYISFNSPYKEISVDYTNSAKEALKYQIPIEALCFEFANRTYSHLYMKTGGYGNQFSYQTYLLLDIGYGHDRVLIVSIGIRNTGLAEEQLISIDDIEGRYGKFDWATFLDRIVDDLTGNIINQHINGLLRPKKQKPDMEHAIQLGKTAYTLALAFVFLVAYFLYICLTIY